MSDVRRSGQDDPDDAFEMEDFDPNDPDAVIVHYDLGNWAADDQAELAEVLAERHVVHAWGGPNELLVPESNEDRADAIIDELERRLGVGLGAAADLAGEVVEYELAEWPEHDRAAIVDALAASNVAHRWDEHTLIVPAADESTVDELLDAVERGEVIGDLPRSAAGDDADESDERDTQAMHRLFLAGEVLATDSASDKGLEHLVVGLRDADPGRPPFGVERSLWRRACELADDLADAVAPEPEGTPSDAELVEARAAALRDWLRSQV